MIYLVASAQRSDLPSMREATPELWRQVRRYNQPVQLALAAAEDVIQFLQGSVIGGGDFACAVPTRIGRSVSLGSCCYGWDGKRELSGIMRMNPTQTLHAVDNLALSAFAIAHDNRSYCLGLGGAAGQAWCGLEAVLERLHDAEDEVLLMAGDQDAAEDGAPGLGCRTVVFRSH